MAGTFNPMIAVFNMRLADLGFTTGYSLKRWRMGLNIMLKNNKETSMWRNYESSYYSKATSTTTISG